MTIGGYPVVKKWLSYREFRVLGRPLLQEEMTYITEVVRRSEGPAADGRSPGRELPCGGRATRWSLQSRCETCHAIFNAKLAQSGSGSLAKARAKRQD